MREVAGDEKIISFSGGLPSAQTFPREQLAKYAEAVLREGPDEVLQYGWPEGQPELRELIARRLERRGLKVNADDVLVTNGAQDAIGFVVDVMKARVVQVDALTYSHRGLHSRAPSRPYFPFLFRGYRLYTGEQSTWIDRNMNGERTLPFTFPLHSLYNRNHGAD